MCNVLTESSNRRRQEANAESKNAALQGHQIVQPAHIEGIELHLVEPDLGFVAESLVVVAREKCRAHSMPIAPRAMVAVPSMGLVLMAIEVGVGTVVEVGPLF